MAPTPPPGAAVQPPRALSPAFPAAARPPTPPAAAAPPDPVEEPPYDPAQHHGLSEGAWLHATRGTARRSTGMMVTGIGFITLGASLLAAGTGIFLNDNGCQGFHNACNSGKPTGMALLSAGLIGLGLGIPLTIHGATDVPRAEAGSARADERPRVTLGFGLHGAALALHF